MNHSGWAPLHWSALKGSAPIAQQLLRFGARVDVRENESRGCCGGGVNHQELVIFDGFWQGVGGEML